MVGWSLLHMIPELSLIFEFEFDKELAIDWGKLSKKNVKTYRLFHILVYNIQQNTFIELRLLIENF